MTDDTSPTKPTVAEMRTTLAKLVSSFLLDTHPPLESQEGQVINFNRMYKLPYSSVPTTSPGFDVSDRLAKFKKILLEEVDEIEEIIEAVKTQTPEQAVEVDGWLTGLVDLLTDIQVYSLSEAKKFGIPTALSMNIVMQSNKSKLDADGQPIYDVDGKVQKGPNYWKPEPRLSKMLKARLELNDRIAKCVNTLSDDRVEQMLDKNADGAMPSELIAVFDQAFLDGTIELSTSGAEELDSEERTRVVDSRNTKRAKLKQTNDSLEAEMDAVMKTGGIAG